VVSYNPGMNPFETQRASGEGRPSDRAMSLAVRCGGRWRETMGHASRGKRGKSASSSRRVAGSEERYDVQCLWTATPLRFESDGTRGTSSLRPLARPFHLDGTCSEEVVRTPLDALGRVARVARGKVIAVTDWEVRRVVGTLFGHPSHDRK
jgi:hypothetical protein